MGSNGLEEFSPSRQDDFTYEPYDLHEQTGAGAHGQSGLNLEQEFDLAFYDENRDGIIESLKQHIKEQNYQEARGLINIYRPATDKDKTFALLAKNVDDYFQKRKDLEYYETLYDITPDDEYVKRYELCQKILEIDPNHQKFQLLKGSIEQRLPKKYLYEHQPANAQQGMSERISQIYQVPDSLKSGRKKDEAEGRLFFLNRLNRIIGEILTGIDLFFWFVFSVAGEENAISNVAMGFLMAAMVAFHLYMFSKFDFNIFKRRSVSFKFIIWFITLIVCLGIIIP